MNTFEDERMNELYSIYLRLYDLQDTEQAQNAFLEWFNKG
jgi:hypothetical protein